jgi:hypothetical protein
MIKVSTLAIAIAVAGPLIFAGPVLSSAAGLKETAPASDARAPRHVARQYWDYVPNTAYPSSDSYYNDDYWRAVGPLSPERDPYAGTYWDGVAPY